MEDGTSLRRLVAKLYSLALGGISAITGFGNRIPILIGAVCAPLRTLTFEFGLY
jgi:hypothetical protein